MLPVPADQGNKADSPGTDTCMSAEQTLNRTQRRGQPVTGTGESALSTEKRAGALTHLPGSAAWADMNAPAPPGVGQCATCTTVYGRLEV